MCYSYSDKICPFCGLPQRDIRAAKQGAERFMKVLIVSHNVFSMDSSMGKTLHAYFKGWAPEDLCQLYFYSEVPTTHLCANYFQVTDFDLVKAFLLRRPGRALTSADAQPDRTTARTDTGAASLVYQTAQKRAPWMYAARNGLWRLGAWNTRALDRWVRQQKPDVIFYASGDYAFSYRVTLHLAKTYHIPVVVSVMDDYYFYRGEYRTPLAHWNTRVLRRVTDRLMSVAGGAVYIIPSMQKLYDEKFGVPSRVLYKTAEWAPSTAPANTPVRISYLGGLDLFRHESLMDVGRLLRQLVPDGSVLLDVYSGEKDPALLQYMTEENGIRFRGAASPREVRTVLEESDILLMAESLRPELHERLRYALSTKTAECLGSGRCLLAYGPIESGTISYLAESGDLCVATDRQQLEARLREILFSDTARQHYAARQLALAEKNHNEAQNRAVLKDILELAVRKRP